MKVAVTYENGQIFQHFGHTETFKIYDLEGTSVTGVATVDTGDSGHGALAGFLKELGVSALICGNIGAGARAALDAAGIDLYGGVSGSVDDAVLALLAGKLRYNPEVTCNHHGAAHDGPCGDHDSHSCSDHCHSK